MLFRRRRKPNLPEKLRNALWPQRGLKRSAAYFGKRLLRVQGQPHAIAAGFAAGASVSFLPFMGFHFLLGALLALVTRGNMLASALGTAVGNPLTFPFIWATSYWIGSAILPGEATSELAVAQATESMNAGVSHGWGGVLVPMVTGGAVMGVAAWIVSYVVVHRAVQVAQERRRRVLRTAQARGM